jgi:hypothetical protein
VGKSNIMGSKDVATPQVLAALSEMMSRLDGFQKVLDASAMAKSSCSPTVPMQTTAESVAKDLPRSETSGTQARGHRKGMATKAHKSNDHTRPDDGDGGSSSSDDDTGSDANETRNDPRSSSRVSPRPSHSILHSILTMSRPSSSYLYQTSSSCTASRSRTSQSAKCSTPCSPRPEWRGTECGANTRCHGLSRGLRLA